MACLLTIRGICRLEEIETYISHSVSLDTLVLILVPLSVSSIMTSLFIGNVICFISIIRFAPYQADPFQRVSGGIILAPEGINGSICGSRDSVERVLEFIQSDNRLKGLRRVESPVTAEDEAIHHGHSNNSPLAAGEDAPFRWDHVRVKLKKEVYNLKTQLVYI